MLTSVPLHIITSNHGSMTDTRPDGVTHDKNDQDSYVFPEFSETKNRIPRIDYKVLIAKHADASNPYQRTGAKVVLPRISSSATAVNPKLLISQSGYCSTAMFPGVPSTSFSDLALRDLALARLKAKLATSFGNAQALVPLVEIGELHRTIKSLAKPTESFLRIFTVARKKRTAQGKRAYNDVDLKDLWLTYSFGIKPMMSDAESISRAIAEFIAKPSHMVRASGRASREWVGGITTPNQTGVPGIGSLKYSQNLRFSLSYTYTAGANLAVKSANNYGVKGLFSQLGMTDIGNLPSVGWELLPYSWLIDYFTTTGAYLEDVFSSDAGTTVYCTLGTLLEIEGNLDVGFILPTQENWSYSSSDSVSGGYLNYFDFTRDVYGTQIPHRSLRFKTVDEVGRNAINRLLNLTALLRR